MNKTRKRHSHFAKDLPPLLFGCGDVNNPLSKTVQALDDVLTSYMIDMCHSAHINAQTVRRNKYKLDDFKYALRFDPAKLGRGEDMINRNKYINDTRKAVDVSEGKFTQDMMDEHEPQPVAITHSNSKDPVLVDPATLAKMDPNQPLTTIINGKEVELNPDGTRKKRKYTRRKPLEKKDPEEKREKRPYKKRQKKEPQA